MLRRLQKLCKRANPQHNKGRWGFKGASLTHTLASMTGFAREQGALEGFTWTWELRSVNGKGSDFRLRLPSGYEALESEMRGISAKYILRGNLQASLSVQDKGSSQQPRIAREALISLYRQSAKIAQELGVESPELKDLLALRGVVEMEDGAPVEAETKARSKAMLESFDVLVAALAKTRRQEGTAIGNVLLDQLHQIEVLVDRIVNDASRTPKVISQRLTVTMDRLLESSNTLEAERLHQEAVILAAKADISEELDRLAVHLKAARQLIEAGGAVGRKLDFLAQEFNRECNTICSKSNSADVTAMALDMKLLIDQFREQVQNIE